MGWGVGVVVVVAVVDILLHVCMRVARLRRRDRWIGDAGKLARKGTGSLISCRIGKWEMDC